MNNRGLLVLLVVIALAIGGYMVYENQQDDIEIELPDVDVN
jgi:uncharacterized protein HemX